MNSSFDLKNTSQESALFQNRAIVLSFFVLLLFFALIARLIFLQINTHAEFENLSQSNRVKLSVIPPIRGLIYDANNKILAENKPSYSLELIPEQIKDIDQTLEQLSTIVPVSESEKQAFKKQQKRHRSFESIPLRSNLSDQEVAALAAHRHEFEGVEIQARPTRHYPYPELTSHVIGYVGSINERELKTLDPINYRGTRSMGKTGIEKKYEDALHGQVGYQHTENTARGRALRVLSTTPPISGQNLTLHLDIDLQRIAYDALGEYNGTVTAIDPRSGAVKAMVSKPGFNANLFSTGIDQTSYTALQNSPDRPLFDRTLRGQYPPGSTLKPFFGLAGLEYNVINENQKIFCPGFYQLPKQEHKYRDWKKTGHGAVDLAEAVEQSCDVYFYILAQALKIDRMHALLDRFGFGKRTGIDLIGEKAGLLPSREWKKRAKNQPWYPGETLIAGIGQGFNLTTSTQLAHATALLSKRGEGFRPTLLKKMGDDVIEEQLLPSISLNKPKHWDSVIQSMSDVVNGARGTARSIAVNAPYSIAGKTGTAQVFSIKQDEEYDEETVSKHLKDHALFIAFAPIENPQLAIAVIAENGGHGSSVAAPIARKMFDHYLQ